MRSRSTTEAKKEGGGRRPGRGDYSGLETGKEADCGERGSSRRWLRQDVRLKRVAASQLIALERGEEEKERRGGEEERGG